MDLIVLHSINFRPETLRLFGIYLAERRDGKSLGEIADGSDRTLEWFGAVERGEIVPTYRQLVDLVKPYDDDRLGQILIELEHEPWGPRASGLRKRHGVSSPAGLLFEEKAQASGALLAVEGEISQDSRLLVVSPVAVLLAFVFWYVGLGPWSGIGPRFHFPGIERYIFILALIVPTFVFLLQGWLDQLFCKVTRCILTTSSRFWVFTKLEELREDERLRKFSPEHSTNWAREEDRRSMLRSFRARSRRVALATEMIDRLAVVVFGMFLLTEFALIVALSSDRPQRESPGLAWHEHDLAWLILIAVEVCVLLALAALHCRSARVFLRLYHIGIGLGK